eukprot:498402_1
MLRVLFAARLGCESLFFDARSPLTGRDKFVRARAREASGVGARVCCDPAANFCDFCISLVDERLPGSDGGRVLLHTLRRPADEPAADEPAADELTGELFMAVAGEGALLRVVTA